MEKEIQNKVEVLLYRLIKSGVRQRCAKKLIIDLGEQPGDLGFIRQGRLEAAQEAGEVRDELFDLLVAPERREEAVADEAFCNDYEIYMQCLWAAACRIRECESEITETENPELEKHLRGQRNQSMKKLEALKQEIVNHLTSRN
mgnify:CR=1 FL=1